MKMLKNQTGKQTNKRPVNNHLLGGGNEAV